MKPPSFTDIFLHARAFMTRGQFFSTNQGALLFPFVRQSAARLTPPWTKVQLLSFEAGLVSPPHTLSEVSVFTNSAFWGCSGARRLSALTLSS
eukprot:2835787-Pleurochrysis_carterae.AAC.1